MEAEQILELQVTLLSVGRRLLQRLFDAAAEPNPVGAARGTPPLPQTGHYVGIHVFAVAIGESSVGSSISKQNFLVEGYGGRIIRVHAKVQPRKIQPVVCEVEAGLHQRVPMPLPCQSSLLHRSVLSVEVLGFM